MRLVEDSKTLWTELQESVSTERYQDSEGGIDEYKLSTLRTEMTCLKGMGATMDDEIMGL